MTERIANLVKMALKGKLWVQPVPTVYDREDLFLDSEEMSVKRTCEYILNQEPLINDNSLMTGFLRFDGSCVGDAFNRPGHKNTKETMSQFYLKTIDGLSTMEWQHATADYKRVLTVGMEGLKKDIQDSLAVHHEPKELSFFNGLTMCADAVIGWGDKCSMRAKEYGEKSNKEEVRANMKKLSEALKRVPRFAPTSFYEAVLTVYVCYSFDPDSVGCLDRVLMPFYEKDIQNGTITREEAGEYLQELFIMLQAKTCPQSPNFTRGGESHFCVGGYLPNGEDCFSDLSRLIVESLIELPICCPQITMRWTKRTKKEDFVFCLNMERHDTYKRIAFTNDEKRIECYTKICGIPFEHAVNYTTVGCNEPVFAGSICGSSSYGNMMFALNGLLHEKRSEVENISTFDKFWTVFWKEFAYYLDKVYDYDDKYNYARSKDTNYITSLFMNGPIQNARSLTQGGCTYALCSPTLVGLTTVIDCIAVIKKFVYDEKTFTFTTLLDALHNNWQGYEDVRQYIIKNGEFFGDDGETSNDVAKLFFDNLYTHLKDKTNLFGYHLLSGDLLGYNPHHEWMGKFIKASPDGRYDGEMLSYCLQGTGKNKNGVTALLNSVIKAQENCIACGNTVTNIDIDKMLVENDEYFEKTADMLLTYFQNGGVHFQLTYISKEDLINAKVNPEKCQNLRVRVTGFSDYFVKLVPSIQDSIINR